MAKDRSSWRASIHKGTTQFEIDRISQAKQKRQQRKDRLLHLPDSLTAATHACPLCRRTYRAEIGLMSHRQRAHNK